MDLPFSDYASDRASSPIYQAAYSNKTGRPIRKSAGKVKAMDGYVDSKVIEDEYDDMLDISSDDDDLPIKVPQKRKRKRSPSPAPPPLERVLQMEQPDHASDSDSPSPSSKTKLPPIQLQFNVPLGFHGPLYVKIDRSMLGLDKVHEMRPRLVLNMAGPLSKRKTASASKKPLGFVTLPAELRNKVYRYLFVTDHVLQFPADRPGAQKDALKRSSQFLRSCKLVHSEGCSILYGENKFVFDRNGTTRGSFWEPVPKEIGYKDIRLFLQLIGPENLLYLRDITLKLQDAMPGATPELDHDKRRYIRDGHLLEVIRTLRQTKLRKLNVIFLGRRQLSRSDSKFVEYLMQIKADEIVSEVNGWWSQKVEYHLWRELREAMTRKTRLYLLEN